MNRIYQVIWSSVKDCYVVVSENAGRHGKKKAVHLAPSNTKRTMLAMSLGAAVLFGSAASASAAAGQVLGGGGTESGDTSSAKGEDATISGGFVNHAEGNYSSVSGGTGNKAFGYGSVELEIDIFALEATIRLLGIAVNVVALIIHTHLTFEVNQFVILSHSRMAKTCGKQQDNCFFHSKCRGYTPEIIEHFKVKAKGVQHPIV